MDDLGERHAELVLVANELDTVLDIRQLFAERPDAPEPTMTTSTFSLVAMVTTSCPA
jgi:hypothetical protein